MDKSLPSQPQSESTGNRRKPAKSPRRTSSQKALSDTLRDVLAVAQGRGLLSGSRTYVVRGRMPAGLIERAKQMSGIRSDSKLLEAALASLAVHDDYAQWLLAQRGTVSPEIDLEF